jgi:superfamily II DNA or RNA helicase
MRFIDESELRPNEVIIKKKTNLTLSIHTEDYEYVEAMREHFTRMVPGFQYMPQYRSGFWNGRACMIEKFGRTFPYGILFDYVRTHKKEFPRNPLRIDDDVKEIFRNTHDYKLHYNLKLKPRPYQDDCIRASLNHTKGIIRSATASGKSLVISYVIWNLFKNGLASNSIIIVPSTSLIKQFHDDMLEYGIPESMIGEVWAKKKQWNSQIVISTWQSLSRNKPRMKLFESVIVDEVHGAKAKQLKDILSRCDANYRLGFTGTLHSDDLDNWNVKSYLGPVIREYSAGELAADGWISTCNVKFLNVEYEQDKWEGTYTEVKQQIFENPYRIELIRNLVRSTDHNILLLVGKVELEGDFLKEKLEGCGKEVIFLSGRDSVDVREKWRKACMKRKDIALIATYGIFQQGINIPNLKYIVLAAPFKSKIRVLQSIGRGLRKHADKENGAIIFDIHDHTRYLSEYGNIRLRYYDSEKFAVEELLFREGDDFTLSF